MKSNREALRGAIAQFNAEALKFVGDLEGWIRKYPGYASEKQIRRADALQSAIKLKRIGDALHWGPSVALYGESQCGKSNLVSRFATGLGARERDGNLLVSDPWVAGPCPHPMPWHDQGQASGSIDFIKWIDPSAGKESTGVVCRFTREAPKVCKDGCFRVEFMSHSELLCSLAMGFNAQVADTSSENRRSRIDETLQKLAASPMVPDREGRMGELYEAWHSLKQALPSTPLMQDLDNGQGRGWDEFVEECLREAKRPDSKNDDDRPSDLERLVSLLWDGNRSITSVWRILHADLEDLRDLEQCGISAEEVCKSALTGGRNSLVAVDGIHSLKSVASDVCLVYGRRPGESTIVSKPIGRANVVALAREFILPIGDGPVKPTEAPFDVLDYPGARAEQQHSHSGDDRQLSTGKEALLRGKINRLFLSGVEHYDATALCLVVAASGNLEAGKPVMRCLHQWLHREEWSEDEEARAEQSLGDVKPPLILAITKSDLLVDDPKKAENRLEAIRKEYSPNRFDWMGNWHGQRPYDGVYWVHNPAVQIGAAGRAQLHTMETERRRAFIRGCLGSRVIQSHTAEAEKRLEALFTDPPSDVSGLLEGIKSSIALAGARRLPGLAGRVLDEVRKTVMNVNAGYMGAASREAVERADRDAAEHVSVLSELSIAGISSLLDGLSLGSHHVLKAWKSARERWVREEPDAHGAVPFDCFYEELIAIFAKQFRQPTADARWRQEVVKRSKEMATAIESRLSQLPNSRWFRDAIEAKAGPLLEQNVIGVSKGRLLLVVTAQWNRCMVWLSADPPIGDEALPDAPVIRGAKANCRGVMTHWSIALRHAYRNLVDEGSLARPHNLDLGNLRQQAAKFIQSFHEVLGTIDNGAGMDSLMRDLAAVSADLADQPAGSAA